MMAATDHFFWHIQLKLVRVCRKKQAGGKKNMLVNIRECTH
jgi:hypothetical protein